MQRPGEIIVAKETFEQTLFKQTKMFNMSQTARTIEAAPNLRTPAGNIAYDGFIS